MYMQRRVVTAKLNFKLLKRTCRAKQIQWKRVVIHFMYIILYPLHIYGTLKTFLLIIQSIMYKI